MLYSQAKVGKVFFFKIIKSPIINLQLKRSYWAFYPRLDFYSQLVILSFSSLLSNSLIMMRKKSCLRETLNLSAQVDYSTDTTQSYLVTKLPSYQFTKLPSYQFTELPRCHVTKLPRCHVTKLPSNQVTKLKSYKVQINYSRETGQRKIFPHDTFYGAISD